MLNPTFGPEQQLEDAVSHREGSFINKASKEEPSEIMIHFRAAVFLSSEAPLRYRCSSRVNTL